jgi:hypothetical protein
MMKRTELYAGDERSNRNLDVHIARAKQNAANRLEWFRRSLATRDLSVGHWINATQLEPRRPVQYVNGHLELA